MPPGASSSEMSRSSTLVAFEKAASMRKVPCGPSSRRTSIVPLPSPPSSVSDPSSEKALSIPKTGSPTMIDGEEISPIRTATGSSGSLKPDASGLGSAGSASPCGGRARTISSAVSVFTESRPRSSAVLLQSSVTPSRVSQMPSSSAIVRRCIVAVELKTPSKPVTRTSRPAPDRFRSRNRSRNVPPSSSWAKTAPGSRSATESMSGNRLKTPDLCRCRGSSRRHPLRHRPERRHRRGEARQG